MVDFCLETQRMEFANSWQTLSKAFIINKKQRYSDKMNSSQSFPLPSLLNTLL